MLWTKQLQIALAEEDAAKIEALIQELPEFTDLEQMKEAAYMMQEVHNFLTTQKETYATKLVKLKKQKEFLNANLNNPSSFDKSY